MFVIRQIQTIPNDSDEFLKKRDTEVFLKFASCVFTEVAS